MARAASALTVLLGLWLIALGLVYSMFGRADVAEKVTDEFRQTVSARRDGAPFRTLPWLVSGPCVLVALVALATLPAASPRHRERHA